MAIYGKEVISTEFVTQGRSILAKCFIQIFENEANGRYKVTLSKAKDAAYRGVSVTNYFEKFAERIKAKYLDHVHPQNITWCQNLEGDGKEFEDVLIEDVHYTRP